ncbi:hypothetical protein, partial [Klebsiella pneumoniae]|uniref:hypothetical protein n=1 Tax=Klebsiella pneumoniae TaxID=573 RepID=UPI00272FEA1B
CRPGAADADLPLPFTAGVAGRPHRVKSLPMARREHHRRNSGVRILFDNVGWFAYIPGLHAGASRTHQVTITRPWR